MAHVHATSHNRSCARPLLSRSLSRPAVAPNDALDEPVGQRFNGLPRYSVHRPRNLLRRLVVSRQPEAALPNAAVITYVVSGVTASGRELLLSSPGITFRENRQCHVSTHSRRSASVGTVGKHLFFDRVAASRIATQDARWN